MEKALKDIEGRMAALLRESDEIATKGLEGDFERLKTINVEMTDLKGKKETLKSSLENAQWARMSAGMLPLTGNPGEVTVQGVKKTGETVIEDQGNNILINQDGEGLLPAEKVKLIRSAEYKSAVKSYMRKLGEWNLGYDALKVLQEGADTSGGYLVPEDMLNRLIAKEPAPTTIGGRVSRLTTSKDVLSVPRVVYTTDNQYTSGMRVTWTGEVPASATTHRVTEPSFGQVRIPIFTAMMSLPLTNDLIDDASYPLMSWCTSKFEETIRLLQSNMIINGGGATEPQGILVNSQFIANDVHTGTSGALTWDGILNTAFALPEQYDENAVWVMNKASGALNLSKLQDGEGRPYWSMGTGDSGLVGMRIKRDLIGYPVIFDSFMPNVSAGLYPIIFGDLRGYYLVNRAAFSVQYLRELYAETGQIVLLGKIRFGGQLVEDYRVVGHVASA